MTMFIMMNAIGSVIYGVLTSTIRFKYSIIGLDLSILTEYLIDSRFIFVRSSMQEKIQNVLKRNSFRAQVLCIGIVVIIANYAFYFYEQLGKEKSVLNVLKLRAHQLS